MNRTEERTVEGMPGITVTEAGTVLLNGQPVAVHHSNGYQRFHFKSKVVYVHTVVCEAFHGPRPCKDCEAHHKDENRTNNAPGNLEWLTKADHLGQHRRLPKQKLPAYLKSPPPKPRPDFPLFAHRGGQWRKDIWENGRSVPYYFGSWDDDPKGERALRDWVERKDAIKAGLDKLRTGRAAVGDITLDDLSAKFLASMRLEMTSGGISLTHYGSILREVQWCVQHMGERAVVNALQPQDFSVLAGLLVKGDGARKPQGIHARKRIIAVIRAMFNWGDGNGLHKKLNYGTDFVTPDTSPQALRKAKVRAGKQDFSKRIVTGGEIDKLLERAQAQFKAIILLSVNCGLGPADLGRLRWHMLDLENRRLTMPRGKTGEERHGFLWKKTVAALKRVQTLKHNAKALAREGQQALVFITRKGLPMYREVETVKDGVSTGVKIDNAISGTFSKMAKELELAGVTQYRLRHTFKTLGKKARDPDALNFMMGHAERTTGKTYDHEEISWKRVRRVARVIHGRLWRKPKPVEGSNGQASLRLAGDAHGEAA